MAVTFTALTPPRMGALNDTQTPADGFSAGNYTSSAGTISSQTVAYFVNGAPAAADADLVGGDTVWATETVVDSADNERVFSANTVGVDAIVVTPTVTAPVFDGSGVLTDLGEEPAAPVVNENGVLISE